MLSEMLTLFSLKSCSADDYINLGRFFAQLTKVLLYLFKYCSFNRFNNAEVIMFYHPYSSNNQLMSSDYIYIYIYIYILKLRCASIFENICVKSNEFENFAINGYFLLRNFILHFSLDCNVKVLS